MPAPPAGADPAFGACARAFEAEFDHVYRAVRRMGAPPAEAEDLAQDVFVVMWRRWADFQHDRPLRPWLTGIAQNIALDHFRRRRNQEVAAGALEALDEAPDPEQQLAAVRARQLALQALAALPEQHRSVLVRHDLDGVPIRAIAAESALPFFTVAARLRRARLRFAKLVKRLQRGSLALVPPGLVLDREREVPAVSADARQRMIARLPQGPGSVPPAHAPALAGGSRLPLVPFVALALAIGLLALVFWRPAQVSPPPAVSGDTAAVQTPRRSSPGTRMLPPPRLILAARTQTDPTPPPDPLARGLIAHWRFDEQPGNQLAGDASGNARTCLLHDLDPGAAWVPGVVGGAIDLGGRGWLECPMPEARAGQPMEVSITAWIKRHRWQASNRVLFTRQLASADAAHLFWFGMLGDSVRAWSGAWTGWATHEVPTLAEWTHVAFVHSNRWTRLYIDGVLVRHKGGARPRGEGLVQSALTIGGARYLADPQRIRQRYDGLIDEARVYDRVLEPTEVATLATRPQ